MIWIIINMINNIHDLDSATPSWLDKSPNLYFSLLALKSHLCSPVIIIAIISQCFSCNFVVVEST